MKRKPWPLIVLALIHFLAPIGNIIINSYLMESNPVDYLRALLHPSNIVHATIFFGIPIFSSMLIYICKKWSYYLYVGVMSVPFIYSFFSWTNMPGLSTGFILILFYVINIMIVGYFLLPTVRRVYFDPRLRWWETRPRYLADYQATILIAGQSYPGQVKNISQSGIFVESESEFDVDQNLSITFKVADEKFELKGDRKSVV